MFRIFPYMLVLPFHTLGGDTEGNPLPFYQWLELYQCILINKEGIYVLQRCAGEEPMFLWFDCSVTPDAFYTSIILSYFL